MMACLGEEVIVDLVEGRLDEASLDGVTSHLDSCSSCRALVADSARAIDRAPAPLPRGANVGRYVVFNPVGSGAMGTVYAGYDPELDRKIALKLLRADALADRSSMAPMAPMAPVELGARLVREAQALAKLSHPNVVAVYDVGKHGDEIFVAMEFVEGTTLTGWLHERPRPLGEVLRVFRLAGEGLAAAHAAGIVHRDFKPENVLIGRDGRVLVGDFGLARTAGSGAESAGGDAARAAAASSSPTAHATHTGALIGTPAYMAPEQWAGQPSDARADLFSFSVALFEALYGVRPFDGGDPSELPQRLRAEAIAEPAGRHVPSWLRRIVVRGLRAEPAARWPAMRPLLDALAKGPSLTPRKLLLGGGALAFVMVALVAAARLTGAPPCSGAAAAWGDLWNPAQRDRIAQAFARTGRPSAARAFAAVDAALTGFRARWIGMHTDACVATHVRGDQSEALLDLRMTCLDDRKKEAAALTRVWEEATAASVDRWSNAVSGLDALDACANTKALTASVPLPRDRATRARIDQLTTALADAKALYWSGQYRRAADASAPLAAEARALGYAPLAAHALLVQGDAEQRLSALEEARRDLDQAAVFAVEGRDDLALADAWILLVRVDGYLRQQTREGERWGEYARAALARVGGDDEREATRLRNLVTMEHGPENRAAHDAASLQMLRRARELYEHSREPQRAYYQSDVDETIAALLYLSGRTDEALATYHDTEVTRTRIFGPSHPRVAVALGNQADCLLVLGRLDEALANWERVAALIDASGGDEAWYRIGRAQVLRAKGQFALALADDTRALAVAVDNAGADSPQSAEARTGQGLDLLGLHREGEAVAPLERALAWREKAVMRPDFLAETRFALARALAATGDRSARPGQLAEAARNGVRQLAAQYGSFYARMLTEIDAWAKR